MWKRSRHLQCSQVRRQCPAGITSQDDQPRCCRESRGWGGCRRVRSLGREAAESWSLLAVSASMCGEVGVWHRAGKANQLINSMRKQQE